MIPLSQNGTEAWKKCRPEVIKFITIIPYKSISRVRFETTQLQICTDVMAISHFRIFSSPKVRASISTDEIHSKSKQLICFVCKSSRLHWSVLYCWYTLAFVFLFSCTIINAVCSLICVQSWIEYGVITFTGAQWNCAWCDRVGRLGRSVGTLHTKQSCRSYNMTVGRALSSQNWPNQTASHKIRVYGLPFNLSPPTQLGVPQRNGRQYGNRTNRIEHNTNFGEQKSHYYLTRHGGTGHWIFIL